MVRFFGGEKDFSIISAIHLRGSVLTQSGPRTAKHFKLLPVSRPSLGPKGAENPFPGGKFVLALGPRDN
jgi:hypothetical protein